MTTTTESPFSLTIKVGPNNDLLTGRAETRDEMLQRIIDLQILKSELEMPSAAPQQNVQHIAPATVEQAVQNFADAGMTGQVMPPQQAAAIEQRDDKWGNKYTRGMPDAGTCQHGPRIVKNGTNKAGRAYKAYVCVNDSPFGDYKQTKCDIAWPAR